MNEYKNKYCLKCGSLMMIDEWEGWIWRCINCDFEEGAATGKEIIEWEKYNGTWTQEEIDEAKKEAKKIQEDLNWK